MIKDLPNIEKVEASGRLALRIKFTRGGWKTVRLAEFIAREKAMSSLRNQTVFRKAMVSDWGGGVVWPGGLNLGASTLWRWLNGNAADCAKAAGPFGTRASRAPQGDGVDIKMGGGTRSLRPRLRASTNG